MAIGHHSDRINLMGTDNLADYVCLNGNMASLQYNKKNGY